MRTPASVVVGATMATLAEFPDRTLLGEDVIWSGSPEQGMLSSHRILSTATHMGDGIYLLDISHADFGSLGAAPATLRREFTLFDEISVWKQILLHAG